MEIKDRLIKLNKNPQQVELYINDLDSYGDEEDYINITDEELIFDFEEYIKNLEI